MKRIWIHIGEALLLAAVTALLIYLDIGARKVRSEMTCTGIAIEISDQHGVAFVSKSDIESFVERGWGKWAGKNISALNLGEIEALLDGKGAIKKSEAYITADGMLHIMVTQRVPKVRFMTAKGGYYADEEGIIFPLQKNYTSRVPIIDGNVPLSVSSDHIGAPTNAKEQKWLEGILALTDKIQQDKDWKEAVAQIHVDSKGQLVLVPRAGEEKFILGRPDDLEKKFGKIRTYYRYIVPEKGEGYYSTVNVAYDGQIICRK